MLVLDASLRLPTAWVLFALLSVLTYHRAYQTNRQLLLLFVLFTVAVDALIYVILVLQAPPAWLPVIANSVIYAYMLAVFRGVDTLSWALWILFIAVDVFGRSIAFADTLAPLAVHCVGYGSYLILTETIGVIVDSSAQPVVPPLTAVAAVYGDSAGGKGAGEVVDSDVAAFVGTTPIADDLAVLAVENVTPHTATVAWGLILPGPFLPLAASSVSPAYFSHLQSLLASTAAPTGTEPPASLRSRHTSSAGTGTGTTTPPTSVAGRRTVATAPGPAAHLRLPGQAVPPIREWGLTADHILVLLDDEVLAPDRWHLERPAGADAGTGVLTVAKLEPETLYRLRVLARIPKVPCILASFPVHFATPEAPPIAAAAAAPVAIAAKGHRLGDYDLEHPWPPGSSAAVAALPSSEVALAEPAPRLASAAPSPPPQPLPRTLQASEGTLSSGGDTPPSRTSTPAASAPAAPGPVAHGAAEGADDDTLHLASTGYAPASPSAPADVGGSTSGWPSPTPASLTALEQQLEHEVCSS